MGFPGLGRAPEVNTSKVRISCDLHTASRALPRNIMGPAVLPRTSALSHTLGRKIFLSLASLRALLLFLLTLNWNTSYLKLFLRFLKL